MKLKTLLQYKNRYLYIVVSLTIFILIINSLVYVILMIPFGYYMYNMHKDMFKIIIGIILVYLISLLVFNIQKTNEKEIYEITVIKDIKVDTYTSFTGRINTKNIKVYFDEDLSIKPGDILLIEGDIEFISKSTIPNTFDYNNYLKSQGIKYSIFANKIEYKSSRLSIFIIPYYIEKYIDSNLPLSGGYVKTFILADKTDISLDVRDQINETGISHLFAVSGLHIALLVISIGYLLEKTKLNKTNIENTIMSLLLVYLVITSFSASVTRASIMYVLLVINKRYKLEFSTLDILSIILICLLIIRPYYYYDAGFLLSFIVTYFIILSNLILKKKQKLQQLFLISFIAFLVTIPIILKLNYQINILSLFLNVIFLIYVSYIILPLSYIAFIFPYIDKINYFSIYVFEKILDNLSNIRILIIKLYFPNVFTTIFYYSIVFIFLISFEKNTRFKEKLLSLFLLLVLIYVSPNLDPRKSVNFIDIYGDSTLISDSFNRCNILIDTGENDEYNSVISYIKSKNIRKLDYLIISHYHSDHYGESEDILNEIFVETVISKDNVFEYENDLIQCGSISMFIYPFEYNEQNENNNSIIMSLFIDSKHYLFTGDIESSRELDFVEEFDIDIDYLKVAHHGSITSSSYVFLNSVEAEEAFIIVSVNNLHGHPHEEVIKRYEDLGIVVYRTDLSGTIEVYYLFGKEYKRIHSP